MERLFRFLDSNLASCIKAWVVYFISVVLNQIEDENVIRGQQSFCSKMIDISNSSIFILYISLFAIVVAVIAFFVLRPVVARRNPSTAFNKIMLEYTDKSLLTDINGGVSWGQNKAILFPPFMVRGWKTNEVLLENYDDIQYTFDDEELKAEHEQYINTESFKSVRQSGNDLKRYMLTRYKQNFDRYNPKLILDLKKTAWNQTSFVWNKAGLDQEWKQNVIHNQLNTKTGFLPNSLCLHLIVETRDRKVVITEISKAKANDYPSTKAVTLGEQIELSDLHGKNDFTGDFMKIWVERAVCEEFGLTEDDYFNIFDSDSIRILGLELEGNIINYSIPCVIRMKKTCSEFKNFVGTTMDIKEITEINEIDVREIPPILLGYENNKNEWHPSSYLRLLLYMLHRKGYKETCNQILKFSSPKKCNKRS